jgi:hypothetical protein
MTRLQSATEEEIREELEYTIKDFCREGEGWQEVVGPYNLVADDNLIGVNPIDSRREAVYVRAVWYKDKHLGQMSANVPVRENSGTPLYYTCESDPTVLTLVPIPDQDVADAIKVLAVLCPKCPDKWLPDWFSTHHFEAIFDGVLGRFYSQLNKPFSNEPRAAYHLRRYRNKCREARDMATRGYTPGGARWNFPTYGV